MAIEHEKQLDTTDILRQNAPMSSPSKSSISGEVFTDTEVDLILKEIDDRGWRPHHFYSEYGKVISHLDTEAINWQANVGKVISKSNRRRIKAQTHHRHAIARTFRWEPSEFQHYLNTGIRPSMVAVQCFRDILAKSYQRIPRVELPHPNPPDNNDANPPFERNLGGDVYSVSGWCMRLLRNTHYRVTCDFRRNEVWPEVEIILYVRVPHTEKWKRAESFGAVTSHKESSAFKPQVEEWLITCWGKRKIADNARWLDFAPVSEVFNLDNTARLLKLHFAAANRKGGKRSLPAPTLDTGSSPIVHMQVLA